MDLKHNGITWVGNFFQKLEAVCQEVDDIVSEDTDTVKYVKNQFQNMGASVKRFYADVVQDVLPPLVDPVKHEAKAVALKSNAISTCLKSMIGYEENHVDAVIKQSLVEPITVDHVKKQLPDASSGLQLEDHNNSTSEDSLEEAETESSLQKVDGVLTNENANMCPEEDAIEYCTNEVLELTSSGHSHDLHNDINEPGLETIELGDKVKLDEGCVIVEPSELYAVSCRTRKLRSYRRKIQDAFTSKKRLAEEYEQLAIWYGDADMWSSEETLQSTSEIPLDLKNLQIQPACDSDWELL